jgi:hypothetical protein
MRYTLLLPCIVLLSLMGSMGINQTSVPNRTVPIETHLTYRAFKPSSIKKQPRALRQRVTLWGWSVLLGALLIIGALVWLVVWLWPLVAIGWKIFAVIFGLASSVTVVGIALFIFAYAYPTQRDVRSDADARLQALTNRLPFTVEKHWCFPDDEFRISLAGNPEGLLMVDYQQDRAWQVPKGNISAVRSAFIMADSAAITYPQTSNQVVLLTKLPFQSRTGQPPYPGSLMATPMQVIQFQLIELPIEQLTIIYRGAVYVDSTQHIAGDLERLWQQ